MTGFEIFMSCVGVVAVVMAAVAAFSADLMRATLAFSGLAMSTGLLLLGLRADYLSLLLFLTGLFSTIVAVGFGTVLFGNLKTTRQRDGMKLGWDGALNAIVGIGVSVLAFIAFQKLADMQVATMGELVTEPLRAGDLGKAISLKHGPAFEVLGVVILAGVLGAGFLMRKPDAD